MIKHFLRWSIYSIGFGGLLTPLFTHFGLTSFFGVISVSFTFGFFAELLDTILSELKDINNKLK
jgi:hypothetical protein